MIIHKMPIESSPRILSSRELLDCCSEPECILSCQGLIIKKLTALAPLELPTADGALHIANSEQFLTIDFFSGLYDPKTIKNQKNTLSNLANALERIRQDLPLFLEGDVLSQDMKCIGFTNPQMAAFIQNKLGFDSVNINSRIGAKEKLEFLIQDLPRFIKEILMHGYSEKPKQGDYFVYSTVGELQKAIERFLLENQEIIKNLKRRHHR